MNRLNSLRTNCALMVMTVLAAMAAKPVLAGPAATPTVSVTTLADYNSTTMAPPIKGSLRYALERMSGPRVITFAVGGEIKLCCPLYIFQPNVTIDGSTAPAPGITLQRRQVNILNTHHVVLRNLRIRSGDGFVDDNERRSVHGNYTAPGAAGLRSLCIMGSGTSAAQATHAITVENCSIQNSTDDNVSVYGNCRQILLRRCLISGGYYSHKQLLAAPPSGAAPVYYPDWLTIDSCVFTGGPLPSEEAQGGRMPDGMGGTMTLTRNIVVWPHQGSRFTDARANVIGNWFVENPNHPWGSYHDRVVCVNGDASTSSHYVSGNYVNGQACPDAQLFGLPNQAQTDVPASVLRASPWAIWPASSAVASDINVIKGSVIDQAGCVSPGRDALDVSTIEDTKAKAMPSCSTTVDGDMNGDGQVNVQDVASMSQAVLVGSRAPGMLCHGDFNFNGFIDAADAAMLDSMLAPANAEVQVEANSVEAPADSTENAGVSVAAAEVAAEGGAGR